jgi:DnaK suppressor protein
VRALSALSAGGLISLSSAPIIRGLTRTARDEHLRDVSMLKKKDLDEFKALLRQYQSRVRGDVQQLTKGALDGGQGESKSPTHMAELGTDTFEQDFSLGVAERDQDLLEEIQSAIKRIEDGTYGLCEACLGEGKPPSKALIPKARLKAVPFARNCVECERKRERLAY